jgi:hypothetical protein
VCDERKLSDYVHIVGSEQDCPDPFKNHMETLLYSCLSKVVTNCFVSSLRVFFSFPSLSILISWILVIFTPQSLSGTSIKNNFFNSWGSFLGERFLKICSAYV